MSRSVDVPATHSVLSQVRPWKRKCAVDNLKALIPFGSRLRRWKYRIMPYNTVTPRADWALEEGLRQLEWILEERKLEGAVILEIGTGWEPIIPLLFAAAGAERVYMTDLNRLCSRSSVEGAIDALRRNKNKILSRLDVTDEALGRAVEWNLQLPIDEGFSRIGLTYMAPSDCAALALESQSVDVICSRDVLEHIAPPTIAGVFAESHRLLRPGGVACHIVDPSDHWQHADPTISRINFLQFSDAMHAVVHFNRLNYHNRLRHSEYVEMLQAAGYVVLREEREVDEASFVAAETLPLAPRFRKFSPRDLATTGSFILARK